MMKKHTFILSFVIVALLMGLAIPVVASSKKQRIVVQQLPLQTTPRDLELIDVGVVVEVLKSDTLRIGKEHKIYKLDNLRMPLQMNMAARDYLEQNLKGKTVGIYIVGKNVNARKNELGHVLAHIMTQDGKWIQAEMVSLGLAYVTSTPTSRDLVRTLYKYEELGRAQELGLWQYPKYAIKNDVTIRKSLNTFNIYEGVVTNTVQDNKGIAFLNFGADSKTDVTAVIKTEDQLKFIYPDNFGLFKASDLEKRHVRIRGWFDEKDGPMLMITHPEQIEFPGVHGAIPIP